MKIFVVSVIRTEWHQYRRHSYSKGKYQIKTSNRWIGANILSSLLNTCWSQDQIGEGLNKLKEYRPNKVLCSLK